MNFVTKEPINKGWSKDKKYCVTDENGNRYLLRVSDIAEYDKKQSEFNMMKQVSALGVPMCQPIKFGVCDEGVYSIQSMLTVLMQRKSFPRFRYRTVCIWLGSWADTQKDPFHTCPGNSGRLGDSLQP